MAASYLAFLLALLTSHRFPRVSCLVVPPKSLLRRRRCHGRHGSRRLHHYRSGVEGDSTATGVLDNDFCGENYIVGAQPTMVPLSPPPLLLLQSSAPIMSRDACSLLSQYFDRRNDNADHASRLDSVQTRAAESLLSDIHDLIDVVTNCPRHDGEVQVPRYVRYHSAVIKNKMLLDPERFGNALLPDGLHVDTNNGKLFRHITAILYLTDNRDGFSMDDSHRASETSVVESAFVLGGGTTFPLAIPTDGDGTDRRDNLQGAARRLLDRDVHHTKRVVDESEASDGRALEGAALDVFHRDNGNALRVLEQRDHRFGVRVMPEAGRLIYFHNVDDCGIPDPLSFHGGEELLAIFRKRNEGADWFREMMFSSTKSILVFFKEIPVQAFRDRGRDGFAEAVSKARTWTKKKYYTNQQSL